MVNIEIRMIMFFAAKVKEDLYSQVLLSSLPPPKFSLRSNNREGTQPCPSTENWIKDLLSMTPPIKKVISSVSLSHQEASTSLLSLSFRGQTE